RRRLVEEDQRRPVQQHTCDGQLLLHTATPHADALFAPVVKADVSQQLPDARLALGGGETPDTSIKVEVVFSGQPLVEATEFEQGAGALPDGASLRARIEAENLRLTGGRLQ